MNWLLNLFRHKPVVKLFAFLGATALWFFVMSEQNPIMDSTVSVPVSCTGAPGLCVITPSERVVKVKVRGPRSVFASIQREDIKAILDLTDRSAGTHHLRLHTILPQGLEEVSISPASLDVLIDPIIETEMAIHLFQVGAVGDGFTVSKVTPEVETVLVKGPQSKVNTVAQVMGYVNLSMDQTTDFDSKVALSALDQEGHPIDGVTVAPDALTAHIQLARGLSKKIVDVKPVLEGAPAPDYMVKEIQIEPTRIEIAGEATALARISALETEPIPISGLGASTKRTVNLVLPEGVTVTNRMVKVAITVILK